MRKIESLQELAQLQAARRGYIANLRDDRRKLHWAGCHAVEGMYTPKYAKVFFEDLEEAREWLDTNYPSGWEPCGYCEGRLRKRN